MRPCKLQRVRRSEAGFSIVELLMAAFILAIGLLGLTMLQVMSLKGAQGGKNLNIAVNLASRVMDQVELEARLTYLNTNLTDYTSPSSLTGLRYYNQNSVTDYYTIDPASGGAVEATAATALFTVQMTQAYVAGTNLSDVTVLVTYADSFNGASPVQRRATITRRILHG